jgi:hypothetical protein
MQFRMLASDVEPIHPRAGGASTGDEALYVYLIRCRRGAIYTGITRNVAVRYAWQPGTSGCQQEPTAFHAEHGFRFPKHISNAARAH